MKRILLSCALLCLVTLFSCSDDTSHPVQPGPQTSMLLVGEQSSNGLNVQVLATDTVKTGYNTLYIKLTDAATGSVIRNADLTLTPMMDMDVMRHSAPVEQPAAAAAGDVFPAGVVFTMPGNGLHRWMLDINVQTEDERTAEVHIPVAVPDAGGLVQTLTGSDGTPYIVSMTCMCGAAVGMNDIEFLVHRREDMMSFPPVEDLTLIMTPDMPSMGHGSPNNVDPVHTGRGHYKGRVNFTMTGEWRITLQLKRGDVTVGTTSFTVTL